MRRRHTLFGTVEVEAPRFKLCRCRPFAPLVEVRTVSPVCAALTARCTPELAQAELSAHTSYRDAVCILDTLRPWLSSTSQAAQPLG